MSLSPTQVLQRVVLPAGEGVAVPGGAATVLPLYAEGVHGPGDLLGRHGVRVGAGTRVGLGTYFNAFPASYWQRWTDVDEVVLRVEVDGPATVEVYRSDAAGARRRVTAARADGPRADGPRTDGPDRRAGAADAVEVPVPLHGFDEGGWLWFDVRAGDADVCVHAAAWTAAGAETRGEGTVSLGITTYNRVDSCLALLAQLGADDDLLDVVDTVYVVDQGEDRIAAASAFAEATRGLGSRLCLLEQENLGGSGGFARAQLETLRAGRSAHLVLLDDDVVLETASIRRALAFAQRCHEPTLVGAHMFSLPEPTRLHAMAESVELRRFRWGPKHEERGGHDLAAGGLHDTAWLHRREDVNYNGWWMCLIPRAVLEDVGLSMPMFIRWDDAEYGLRCGAAGHDTVTLPGVAVWHVPWTHKSDLLGWQAYFDQRNRIIAALLHSPHEHGGLLLAELSLHQLKHLVAMQYSTAELRLRAMTDVLDGPAGLHAVLASKVVDVRRERERFDDARVVDAPADCPRPGSATGGDAGAEPNGAHRLLSAVGGVARQVLPPSPAARRTPQVHLVAGEAHWSRLLKYDSAVVSTADGAGVTWYRRDRAAFAGLVRRTMATHRRLHRAWPRLAKAYRDALAETASPAAWQRTFESVRRGE